MQRAIVRLILLTGVTLAGTAAAGPLDDATAASRRGDYATALPLYRSLAEQGNTLAQVNLGSMYANGRGVIKDDAEAVKWFRRAAENGDASGQNELGFMYSEGRGLPKDDRAAMSWFRKAAGQGYADAQYNLGRMYVLGLGVAKDEGEAERWYRESAAQGNVLARAELARLSSTRVDRSTPQLQEALRGAEFASRRGAFYEIKTGTSTIYLFGTIHIGRADFYPLNAAVIRALADSSRVYLELDLSNPEVAQRAAQAAQYSNGGRLDEQLPPALTKKVQAALGRYGVSKEMVNGMKPWAVADELETYSALDLGYTPQFAADIYVATVAQMLSKRIFGLESIDEQEQVFDATSDEEQQAFLEAVVAQFEDGRLATNLESLVSAWASGDRSSIEAAVTKELVSETPVEKDMMRRMFADRNARMAERIERIARSGTPTFVAIGVGHLFGPDSVVELLRKRGFTVREL